MRRHDAGPGTAAVVGPFEGVSVLVDGRDASPGASHAFEVDDRVEFTRDGAGPGRGGVMRLLFLRRADGLSRAEFARHWREVHAPLAIRLRPSFDHYVTNIVLDPASEWDGILQQWFADETVFDTHEQGFDGHKRAVAQDIPSFVRSVQFCPQFVGEEVG